MEYSKELRHVYESLLQLCRKPSCNTAVFDKVRVSGMHNAKQTLY